MSRFLRAGAGVMAAGVLLALTACTPGVTQYWRLSDDGSLSTAWCQNRTIDSLTVALVADDYSTVQTFTIEGPALFVEEGQPVSLSRVAFGWSTPPPIDANGDWSKITITSASGDTIDFAGSAERDELALDDWIASPSPSFGTVSCELVV